MNRAFGVGYDVSATFIAKKKRTAKIFESDGTFVLEPS